jgi:hypothetical protein
MNFIPGMARDETLPRATQSDANQSGAERLRDARRKDIAKQLQSKFFLS